MDSVYHWTIGTHTTHRAIPRQTRLALDALGYRLVESGHAEPGLDGEAPDCDLRLVDDDQIELIPSPDDDPDTPVIVLIGTRPAPVEDRRVLGSIRRPAHLQPLYSMLQDALELTPRSSPRIATELPARCVLSDRRWPASVLSLSTTGCLLRSDAALEEGVQLSLQFVIPAQDVITTRARCVSLGAEGAGLVFSGSSMYGRESITHYIVDRLTER
jgi:hypothetical protein